MINPYTSSRFEEAVRAACASLVSYASKRWDEYVYYMMMQDGYTDLSKFMSDPDYKLLEAWWEDQGIYPDAHTCALLAAEERKVFGKSIEDEV